MRISDWSSDVCSSDLVLKIAAERASRKPDLRDDLGRRHVAVQTLLPGGAEAAVHRTTDLRRNAQRRATFLGDINRLDPVAAVEAPHPLARTVRGNLLGPHLRRPTKPKDRSVGQASVNPF